MESRLHDLLRPSLVAVSLLDFIVRVRQTRQSSATRGLASGLGFGPGLLAIAMIIGHFSVFAAILFLLLCMFWAIAIFVVAYVGHHDSESEI